MSEAKFKVEPSGFPGVFLSGDMLLTKNLAPGRRVYGERLFDQDDIEYREWVPNRSKLAAYLRNGGREFPFRPDSTVLYLGASTGTTTSHVSDIVERGRVICLEFSPRTFRDLVSVCESRGNMIPLLGDATRPDDYAFMVEGVDVVYQDIAQKNQAAILVKNMKRFGAKHGMVAIKARSEDVTADPARIFSGSAKELRESGLEVLDILRLEPYEKDHAMIVVRKA